LLKADTAGYMFCFDLFIYLFLFVIFNDFCQPKYTKIFHGPQTTTKTGIQAR